MQMPGEVRSKPDIGYRDRQTVALLADMMQAAEDDNRLPCPIATTGALCLLIFKANATSLADVMRKDHPTILRACTTILTRPRSSEERAELLRRSVCLCDLSGAHSFDLLSIIHDPTIPLGIPLADSRESEDTVLQRLVRSLIVIVLVTHDFGGLRPEKLYHTFKKARRSQWYAQRNIWPTSPHDITPYGVRESITALCSWADTLPTLVLMQLVERTYNASTKKTLPTLIFSHIYPMVVVPALERALADFDHRPEDRMHIKNHLNTFVGTVDLLRLLDPNRTDMHQLALLMQRTSFAGEQLIDLLLRVIKAYEHIGRLLLDDEETRQELLTISPMFFNVPGMLHCALDLPLDETRYTPPVIERSKRFAGERDNAYMRIFHYGRYFALGPICGNIPCIRTDVSEGRRMAACAGCRRVFYCSRRCQREAWSDAYAPHKEMCASIGRVFMAVSRGTGQINKLGMELADFKEGCMLGGIDEELACAVADYFSVIYLR